MNPMFVILGAAVVVDWIVAAILVRAAFRFPHVSALRERAVLAVAIGIAVTIYVVAAWNVDYGGWFDLAWSRTVARFCVALIGLVPLYWLALYVRGDFGKDE